MFIHPQYGLETSQIRYSSLNGQTRVHNLNLYTPMLILIMHHGFVHFCVFFYLIFWFIFVCICGCIYFFILCSFIFLNICFCVCVCLCLSVFFECLLYLCIFFWNFLQLHSYKVLDVCILNVKPQCFVVIIETYCYLAEY